MVFKVTIQATAVEEKDWHVVATGTWIPGQQPELENEVLPAEVLATLFAVSPSGTEKSRRNEARCEGTAYAIVFRRIENRRC